MTDFFNQKDDTPLVWDLLSSDPWEVLENWIADAKLTELNDPNAMSLATVDQFGMPNVRMVLMKGFDSDGLVFYTNLTSAKGVELLLLQKAAVCFHWKTQRRQVRLRGDVNLVPSSEADEYFASRARTSQLGAWASKQSRPLESRRLLLKEVAKYALSFGVGKIPRPEHWSGFRLVPNSMEFSQEGQPHLESGIHFVFDPERHRWNKMTLQP